MEEIADYLISHYNLQLEGDNTLDNKLKLLKDNKLTILEVPQQQDEEEEYENILEIPVVELSLEDKLNLLSQEIKSLEEYIMKNIKSINVRKIINEMRNLVEYHDNKNKPQNASLVLMGKKKFDNL